MACLLVRPQAPAAAGEDVAVILRASVHAIPVHAGTATTASSLASVRLVSGNNITAGNTLTTFLRRTGAGTQGQQEKRRKRTSGPLRGAPGPCRRPATSW